MLRLATTGALQRQLQPALLAATTRGLATGTDQERLAETLKHKAEDVLHGVEHKVEDVVHKVQDYVHEKKEHAREEAERGMYTADDITEAAAQMAAARGGGTQSIVRAAAETEGRLAEEHKPRHEQHPDADEELLEEATQDWGSAARQREMRGLQEAVKEETKES